MGLLFCYSTEPLLFIMGHQGQFNQLLQRMDHISIYLLIAGTYTPYMLVTLRGRWGWSILGTVWGLALIGIILDSLPRKKQQEDKRIIQLLIYVIMGWIIVIALKPLAENLSNDGVMWLAIGGALYTFGIIFFHTRYTYETRTWYLASICTWRKSKPLCFYFCLCNLIFDTTHK